jgi:hypothetical protein
MATQISPEAETIRQLLLGQRYRAAKIPPLDGAGLYALFLIDTTALPLITVGPSAVLYVGMTESSLEVRNHFKHAHSGFSTLRRSLGALLIHKLALQPIPRAPGRSQSNITNYRFSDDGERCLTKWIEEHLAYGFAPVGQNVRDLERELIAELKPPLNLTALGQWRNPDAAKIRGARRECRDKAQRVQNDGRSSP